MINSHALNIEGVILAGGQGRRMGFKDKGLIHYQGATLVSQLIDKLTPQVSQLSIIANQNHDRYREYQLPVYQDEQEGFLGPLAGIATAMQYCQTPLLMVTPCDSPHLPNDLVEKLYQGLTLNQADIAIACDEHKEHAVVMLVKINLFDNLKQYLASGERRVTRWYQALNYTKVFFDKHHFVNLNSSDMI
ncbi:MAG: molybdenum cofactor guanylyltransferase MobA [Parashewanella sp.]